MQNPSRKFHCIRLATWLQASSRPKQTNDSTGHEGLNPCELKAILKQMWQVTRCKRLTTAFSNFFASLSPISSSFTSLMSPYLTIDEVSTLLKLQSPGAWLSADIERKIRFSLAHMVYSTGRTPEQLMATITKPKILFPAPTIHCSPALTELSETSCGRRMTIVFLAHQHSPMKNAECKMGGLCGLYKSQ